MFWEKVLGPCIQANKAKDVVSDDVKGPLLVAAEKDCMKLTSQPTAYVEQSFKVAIENNLIIAARVMNGQ